MDGPFAGEIGRADIVRRIEAHPIDGDAAAMREAFRTLVLGDARAPADIVDAPVETAATPHGGLRVLPPEMGRSDTAVVWLHGGGYVFGSPETHLRPAAWMAARLGVPVLLPRYPLAPGLRWPAQRQAALQVVRTLASEGRRVLLLGDSAGGHLALTTALAAAREAIAPSGLALFAPNTDRTGLNGLRMAMTPHDPMNADADDRALARICFEGLPEDDPGVSPVLDDLSLLPPLHLEVGESEVLLGDAVALHALAVASGASSRLHIAPDLLHMGQLWAPWWPVARDSLERAAVHLIACLDDRPTESGPGIDAQERRQSFAARDPPGKASETLIHSREAVPGRSDRPERTFSYPSPPAGSPHAADTRPSRPWRPLGVCRLETMQDTPRKIPTAPGCQGQAFGIGSDLRTGAARRDRHRASARRPAGGSEFGAGDRPFRRRSPPGHRAQARSGRGAGGIVDEDPSARTPATHGGGSFEHGDG